MNRRIRISSCILVSALALAACAHKTGSGQDSGQAGIAALGSASPSAGDHYNGAGGADNGSGTDTGTGTGSGNGSGNGGGGSGGGSGSGSGGGSGGHSTPSPSTNPNAPRIVSFTVTNVVCDDYPQGGGFQQAGAATLTWKIANADTVDVLMDGGLWKSYPGSQGSDTLNFTCPLDPPARKVNHTYTVVIKNTNVKKSVTATATSNPSH